MWRLNGNLRYLDARTKRPAMIARSGGPNISQAESERGQRNPVVWLCSQIWGRVEEGGGSAETRELTQSNEALLSSVHDGSLVKLSWVLGYLLAVDETPSCATPTPPGRKDTGSSRDF